MNNGKKSLELNGKRPALLIVGGNLSIYKALETSVEFRNVVVLRDFTWLSTMDGVPDTFGAVITTDDLRPSQTTTILNDAICKKLSITRNCASVDAVKLALRRIFPPARQNHTGEEVLDSHLSLGDRQHTQKPSGKTRIRTSKRKKVRLTIGDAQGEHFGIWDACYAGVADEALFKVYAQPYPLGPDKPRRPLPAMHQLVYQHMPKPRKISYTDRPTRRELYEERGI